MKNKIFLLGLLFVSSLGFISCSEDNPSFTENMDYATLESSNSLVYLNPSESKTATYEIYSTQGFGDVSIMVDESSTMDPSYYTVSELTIDGTTASFDVVFANFDIDNIGGASIVLDLMNESGYLGTDQLFISTSPNCPTLNLTFDNWPEEAAWFISDSNGDTVASGGIEGGSFSGEYAGQSSASITLCQLTAGDYSITVYDAYADGGTAYKMVEDEGTKEVFSIGGGDYTFTTSLNFTIE